MEEISQQSGTKQRKSEKGIATKSVPETRHQKKCERKRPKVLQRAPESPAERRNLRDHVDVSHPMQLVTQSLTATAAVAVAVNLSGRTSFVEQVPGAKEVQDGKYRARHPLL